MNAEVNEPHHGCPECGSNRFWATQDKTEYCTEDILCSYSNQEKDGYPEFDIDDYGDTETHDSETGDMHDGRICAACEHKYGEPVWYGPGTTIEQIAELSGLEEEDVEKLSWIFAKVPHAKSITVKLLPHATLIEATPKSEKHGNGRPNYSWAIERCCACGNETSNPITRTKQVYYDTQPGFSIPKKAIDKRQLPILLRASVCSSC